MLNELAKDAHEMRHSGCEICGGLTCEDEDGHYICGDCYERLCREGKIV